MSVMSVKSLKTIDEFRIEDKIFGPMPVKSLLKPFSILF